MGEIDSEKRTAESPTTIGKARERIGYAKDN